MKTEEAFEPTVWAERLAMALEALAPRMGTSVPEEVDGLVRANRSAGIRSYDQYPDLAQKAQHDPAPSTAFEESRAWLDDEPNDVMAALREHPVINQALAGSGEDEEVQLMGPYWMSRVDLKALSTRLVELAAETDGRSAACTFQRFLTQGEARELAGYDVTLFRGLELNRRLDVGEGAFLAPYGEVESICGPYRVSTIGHPRGGRWEVSPPDEGLKDAAAFVRELAWGPCVSSTAQDLSGTLTTEFRFSAEGDAREDPSSSFEFPEDQETVRDLLCIATGSHVIAWRRYVRVAKWMEGIDPNFEAGWSQGSVWESDPWRPNALSDEATEWFLAMIHGWGRYGGDHRLLRLAIRRLAESRSRIGRLGTEDRILDTAIALEAMYGPFDTKITYNLGMRAGHFLGKDSAERMKISCKVKDFYGARSALIHGSKGRTKRTSPQEAQEHGFDVARRTLLKLLHDGRAPDWDTLVTSAEGGGRES